MQMLEERSARDGGARSPPPTAVVAGRFDITRSEIGRLERLVSDFRATHACGRSGSRPRSPRISWNGRAP
ncbi:MAG: hypothetical protein R2862_10935 [Thermoanaerobaculia bacterium]